MENYIDGNGQYDPLTIGSGPILSEEIRKYAALLWHWGWLLLLFTIIAGGIAYYNSSNQPPVYSASATMLINEARSSNEYANILTGERLAQTYSQLMVQFPVLEGVVQRLGLEINPSSLKNRVDVEVVEQTSLMIVKVTDSDPVRAAQVANTIGIVFSEQNQDFQASRYEDSKISLSTQLEQIDSQIQETNQSISVLGTLATIEETPEGELPGIVYSAEERRELERLQTSLTLYQQIYANLLQSFEQVRLSEIQNTSSVLLVEPATPPGSPINQNVQQDTILGAVIGLMLAGGIVILIEVLNDTIKGPDDIVRHLGIPVLGLIAKMKEDPEGPMTALQPRSPYSEAFRSLRTNIQYASVDIPIRTLLVTSPSPQDGKSTIAANLSTVIAQSGRKVVLMDADLRRPSVHKQMGLSNRKGLTDLFVQENGYMDGSIRNSNYKGLSVISSGGLPPNPAELVGSDKMREVLANLQRVVDVIVVDSPPLTAVTDAAILASKVDGVLIVLRLGQTKIAAAKQAVEQLRRGGTNILGCVLNDVDNRRSRYNYYYKGYSAYGSNDYYYGDPAKIVKKKGKRAKDSRPKENILE